jgi:hypothetical protein
MDSPTRQYGSVEEASRNNADVEPAIRHEEQPLLPQEDLWKPPKGFVLIQIGT